MSRPNAKARWRAKQKQIQAEQFAKAVSELSARAPGNDDAHKLQRGTPSYLSTDTYAKHAHLSGARDRSEITPGKGKIVGGAFKRDTGAVKRFTVKGGKIIDGKFIPDTKK